VLPFEPLWGKPSCASRSSPLTDSNRRPPPYHEREEGADPCGIAHSGAEFDLSLVGADRRVFHGRATLVRPVRMPPVARAHWRIRG
jgi:hypothetical protein